MCAVARKGRAHARLIGDAGYWGDAEQRRGYRAARWMHTGDCKPLTPRIRQNVGPFQDMVIRGGENVYR